MVIPTSPTADDFEALQGRSFRSGDLTLRLTSVTRRAAQPGQEREPFTLVFTGPREQFLPQGTVPLTEESVGAVEIFLVPVGMTEESFEYEAVFG